MKNLTDESELFDRASCVHIQKLKPLKEGSIALAIRMGCREDDWSVESDAIVMLLWIRGGGYRVAELRRMGGQVCNVTSTMSEVVKLPDALVAMGEMVMRRRRQGMDPIEGFGVHDGCAGQYLRAMRGHFTNKNVKQLHDYLILGEWDGGLWVNYRIDMSIKCDVAVL